MQLFAVPLRLKGIRIKKTKNMKTVIFVLTLMAVTLQSCNVVNEKDKSDKEISTEIKVSDFTDISLEGNNNIYFIQGNQTSVKVSGTEDDINDMNIYTKGNTLHIAQKSDNIHSFLMFGKKHKSIDVYVTSPNLRGVSILGSGNFNSNSNIDTDKISLNIIGSGGINMKDIICDNSEINVSGSGTIEIEGLNTAKSNIGIPGSGSISIDNTNINNVTCGVTGSGTIELNNAKIEYAHSSIIGSGNIEIQGNVKEHNEEIVGSGSVNIK